MVVTLLSQNYFLFVCLQETRDIQDQIMDVQKERLGMLTIATTRIFDTTINLLYIP